MTDDYTIRTCHCAGHLLTYFNKGTQLPLCNCLCYEHSSWPKSDTMRIHYGTIFIDQRRPWEKRDWKPAARY
jgi:hypothetical protein